MLITKREFKDEINDLLREIEPQKFVLDGWELAYFPIHRIWEAKKEKKIRSFHTKKSLIQFLAQKARLDTSSR